MAEYFVRSSSGTNDSTPSISDVLPAADELWTITANGASSFRDTVARYPVSLFVSSPTTPATSKSARMRSSSLGSLSRSSAACRSAGLSVISLVDGSRTFLI